jgi:hypothetical protein
MKQQRKRKDATKQEGKLKDRKNKNGTVKV